MSGNCDELSWEVLGPFMDDVMEVCERTGEDVANIAVNIVGEDGGDDGVALRIVVALTPETAEAMNHVVAMIDASRGKEAKQP